MAAPINLIISADAKEAQAALKALASSLKQLNTAATKPLGANMTKPVEQAEERARRAAERAEARAAKLAEQAAKRAERQRVLDNQAEVRAARALKTQQALAQAQTKASATSAFRSGGAAVVAATGGSRELAGGASATARALGSIAGAAAGAATKVGLLGSSGVAALGALAAAAAAVTAAIAAIGSQLAKGVDVNAAYEQAELGVKGVIAGMAELRNAEGDLVKGPEALILAGQVAREQLELLRRDVTTTGTSFTQAAEAFQASLSAGLRTGFSVDQLRELTVGLVQAGGIIGLPGGGGPDQLKSEMRAIFAGDIDKTSQLANGLGITGEMVNQWKASGAAEFYDQLNRRLEVYRQLGVEAANTWGGLLTRIGDARDLFLGRAADTAFQTLKSGLSAFFKTIFDPSQVNGVVTELQGLFEAFEGTFNAIAEAGRGALFFVLETLFEISEYLDTNAEGVARFTGALAVAGAEAGALVSTLAELLFSVPKAAGEVGLITRALQGAAIVAALLRDAISMVTAAVKLVMSASAKVMEGVMSNIINFVNMLPGVGQATKDALESTRGQMAANAKRWADEAFATKDAIERGATNVAATVRSLQGSEAAATLAAVDAMRRRSGLGTPTRQGGRSGRPSPKGIRDQEEEKNKAAQAKADREAQRQAEALAKAKLALEKANTDALERAREAAIDVAQAQLDQALKKRLISEQQYQAARADLDRAGLNVKREAIEAEIKLYERVPESDAVEFKKAEAELTKLRSQLDALKAQDIVIGIKADIDAQELQDALNERVWSIDVEIKELRGDVFGARLDRIAQQELRDMAGAGSDTEREKIAARARVQQQQVFYDRAAEAIERNAALLASKEDAIQARREAGLGNYLDAEAALLAARQQALAQQEQQVILAEALAEQIGGGAVQAAQQLRASLEQAKRELITTRDAEAGKFAEAFINSGVLAGGSFAEGLKAGMRSVLAGVAEELTRDLSKQLAAAIRIGLNSAGMPQGGLGALISAGFGSLGIPGFSGGGYTGRGGKHDAKGIVHADEFVLRKEATRRLPRQLLEYMNAYGRLPRGYYTGGMVGGASSQASQSGGGYMAPSIGAPSVTNNINAALYLDPEQLSSAVLATRNSEAKIIEVVMRNRGKLGFR